jgi:sigma-E factor negative regulatory protein RseC
MGEFIEHTGLVEGIDSGVIYVRIQQVSACSACHAKGACSTADVADKVIEVADNGAYNVGQLVLLTGSYSLGLKAVFYAFILPFLCMFLTLYISTQYTSELKGGLLSLGILLPYYIVLSLFRKSLKKSFTFQIKPI